MKYFITYFPAVLSAIIIISFAGTKNVNTATVFNHVADNENFEQLQCSLKTNIYLGNDYINLTDRESVILSVAKKLDFNDDYTLKTCHTGNSLSTSFNGINDMGETEIKLTTIEQTINNVELSLSQYLYIKIDFRVLPDDISYCRNQLKNYLDENGYHSDIFIDFHGIINGTTDSAREESICNSITSELNGTITDTVTLDNTYTVYGYSDSIDNYIKCDGGKINFNIAFSYNEETDCTEVFLSSPIINYDY